jgi:hypothetical protein
MLLRVSDAGQRYRRDTIPGIWCGRLAMWAPKSWFKLSLAEAIEASKRGADVIIAQGG